jgi:DNA-binding MarR family transcriptional regulator
MSKRADRIETQMGYMLIKMGAAASALLEQTLQPLGLRGRDVRVLELIHGETRSQQDLCRLTGMDRTTMVSVIDELERLGYARRERNATDRRKHVVTLTDQGAAAFGEALLQMANAQEEFLAPLSGQQRDQLRELMTRLFVRDEHATCTPDLPPARGEPRRAPGVT